MVFEQRLIEFDLSPLIKGNTFTLWCRNVSLETKKGKLAQLCGELIMRAEIYS